MEMAFCLFFIHLVSTRCFHCHMSRYWSSNKILASICWTKSRKMVFDKKETLSKMKLLFCYVFLHYKELGIDCLQCPIFQGVVFGTYFEVDYFLKDSFQWNIQLCICNYYLVSKICRKMRSPLNEALLQVQADKAFRQKTSAAVVIHSCISEG